MLKITTYPVIHRDAVFEKRDLLFVHNGRAEVLEVKSVTKPIIHSAVHIFSIQKNHYSRIKKRTRSL